MNCVYIHRTVRSIARSCILQKERSTFAQCVTYYSSEDVQCPWWWWWWCRFRSRWRRRLAPVKREGVALRPLLSYPAVVPAGVRRIFDREIRLLYQPANDSRPASDAIVTPIVSVISTRSRRRSLFAVRLNVLITVARRERYWVAGHDERWRAPVCYRPR